jgi:hypothetical protein
MSLDERADAMKQPRVSHAWAQPAIASVTNRQAKIGRMMQDCGLT